MLFCSNYENFVSVLDNSPSIKNEGRNIKVSNKAFKTLMSGINLGLNVKTSY